MCQKIFTGLFDGTRLVPSTRGLEIEGIIQCINVLCLYLAQDDLPLLRPPTSCSSKEQNSLPIAEDEICLARYRQRIYQHRPPTRCEGKGNFEEQNLPPIVNTPSQGQPLSLLFSTLQKQDKLPPINFREIITKPLTLPTQKKPPLLCQRGPLTSLAGTVSRVHGQQNLPFMVNASCQ